MAGAACVMPRLLLRVDNANIPFLRLLGIPDALRDALLATHPEIFDPAGWNALRERLLAGNQEDVPPYPDLARLAD